MRFSETSRKTFSGRFLLYTPNMPEQGTPIKIQSNLRAEAEVALTELGDRLRQVIGPIVPGTAAPRDLERELGLHKTLCWRVLQVAYSREPLASAAHVPGAEGIEKFLSAAGRRGVPIAQLDGVRTSIARLHDLTKLHAGDRASFEVMLQSLAEPDESAVEFKAARRAGYRAASYSWGVQTAARVLAGIVTPVGDDLVDLATIRAHVGARQLRVGGMLRLSRTVEHDTDDPGPRRAVARPIDPETVVGGVPLLADFCSRPLPSLEAIESADRNVEYRFADRGLGTASAITVFTGEVRRGLAGARWRLAGNTTNALMMTIRDPVGVGVIDLWAPPGFGAAHRAKVVSAAGTDPLSQKPEEWHELPASASVERLGIGAVAARLDEAPDYQNAVVHCFGRLGWSLAGYELHRLRLEYPLLGTCLVLQTTLPDRP